MLVLGLKSAGLELRFGPEQTLDGQNRKAE